VHAGAHKDEHRTHARARDVWQALAPRRLRLEDEDEDELRAMHAVPRG
jgi:hypothetical protein